MNIMFGTILFRGTRKASQNKRKKETFGGIIFSKSKEVTQRGKTTEGDEIAFHLLRFPPGRKGAMYTLEAMIAALLILSTVVSLYSFPKQQENPDAVTIKEKGYSCINDLDNRGLLRHYALSNDTIGIRSYLQECLPKALNFSASFCQACAPDTPGNKSIVSLSYLIAGEGTLFQPTNAILFLWSK